MTSMPQDFSFLKIFFGLLVLLVPFEIISRYPNIDGSRCFRNDVQSIIDKDFRGKNYGLNGFKTILSHFCREFLVFACIGFFIVIRLIVMSY